MADYTHKNLSEVKDEAPGFGVDSMEARFAREDLDAERTGLSHYTVKPDTRMPFGHKHEEAEEIYVIVGGSGRMKLDDDVIEVVELDAIRVAPPVTRAFEAGPEGLSFIALGARHAGDGELIQGWWTD